MPSMLKGSKSSSATPVQPIHAPSGDFITGATAVTKPPGEVRHSPFSPSGSRSTGSRLATTTKSLSPKWVPLLGSAELTMLICASSWSVLGMNLTRSTRLGQVMDQELGGYRLIEELGSGGMGVVYLGVDGGNNPVAVKVLHPHIANDETARRR